MVELPGGEEFSHMLHVTEAGISSACLSHSVQLYLNLT